MADQKNSRIENVQSTSGRLYRALKRTYYRFLRLRGTPRQIGLGMALGVFVGMTPFLGFHTVIAVMLAALMKWSKIAAGLGVFITNPFTAPLIYPLTYKLGVMVAGFSKISHFPRLFEPGGVVGIMKNSPMILVDLLVGGVIVGIPLALVSYYVAFYVVSGARKRMEARKSKRITKKAALLKKKKRDRRLKKSKPGPPAPHAIVRPHLNHQQFPAKALHYKSKRQSPHVIGAAGAPLQF